MQTRTRTSSSTSTNETNDGRLTRVETELESVIFSVNQLTTAVSEQGKQIGQLAVAVNAAAGPRKTDWSTLIAFAMLTMAVGSAAFWPMWMQIGNNKVEVETVWKNFADHQKIDMHPVGWSKVSALEKHAEAMGTENRAAIIELDNKLQKETSLAAEGVRERVSEQQRRLDELDKRLQREFTMLQDAANATTETLQAQMDRRVGSIELCITSRTNRDLEELQKRRLWDDEKKKE